MGCRVMYDPEDDAACLYDSVTEIDGRDWGAYSVGMPAIIIKVTRDGHRKVKRDARKKHRGVVSEYVRDRLGLGVERGDAPDGGAKREA